jgi:ABC-type oligopeptide transport system substrate-binding subunit
MAIPETSDEMLRGDFNVMGYRNPDFDTVCLSSINTLDSDEALRQHIQALRIFNQDLPVLPLYFWPAVVLSRQNVSGLMLDSEGAVYSFEGIDLRENP